MRWKMLVVVVVDDAVLNYSRGKKKMVLRWWRRETVQTQKSHIDLDNRQISN
jgi:hypothetical protein